MNTEQSHQVEANSEKSNHVGATSWPSNQMEVRLWNPAKIRIFRLNASNYYSSYQVVGSLQIHYTIQPWRKKQQMPFQPKTSHGESRDHEIFSWDYCTVSYYTVMYCTELYCRVYHYTVHYTAMYSILLQPKRVYRN